MFACLLCSCLWCLCCVSCGARVVFRVVFRAVFRVVFCAMAHVVWLVMCGACCGSRSVARVVWHVACGSCYVVVFCGLCCMARVVWLCVAWLVWCGSCGVAPVVWLMLCGSCCVCVCLVFGFVSSYVVSHHCRTHGLIGIGVAHGAVGVSVCGVGGVVWYSALCVHFCSRR